MKNLSVSVAILAICSATAIQAIEPAAIQLPSNTSHPANGFLPASNSTINATDISATSNKTGNNDTQPIEFGTLNNVKDEEVEHVLDDAIAVALQLSVASTFDENTPLHELLTDDHLYVTHEELDSVKRCIGPVIHGHLHKCVGADLRAALHDPRHVAGSVAQACIWPEDFERLGVCLDHQHDVRVKKDHRLADELTTNELMALIDRHEDELGDLGEDHSLHHQEHQDHRYALAATDRLDKGEVEAFTPIVQHAEQLHHSNHRHAHSHHHHHHHHGQEDAGHHQHQIDHHSGPATVTHDDDSIAPKLFKRKFGYGPEWQTLPGVRRGHPLP